MKNNCHLQPSEQGRQMRKSHWLASLRISRAMKLSVLFFVGSLGVSYASGTSYAQTAMVSVESQNVTVGEVLKDIEKQSDFDFFYVVCLYLLVIAISSMCWIRCLLERMCLILYLIKVLFFLQKKWVSILYVRHPVIP